MNNTFQSLSDGSGSPERSTGRFIRPIEDFTKYYYYSYRMAPSSDGEDPAGGGSPRQASSSPANEAVVLCAQPFISK